MAVNADGNMPYDICEDEATLDFIESEMAKRGITQEMIDDTRAITENLMLNDLKILASSSPYGSVDLEFKDPVSGATPVSLLSRQTEKGSQEFVSVSVSLSVSDHEKGNIGF